MSNIARPRDEGQALKANTEYDGQFKFVIIGQPQDLKQGLLQKQVRSHVTTLQHLRARKHLKHRDRDFRQLSIRPRRKAAGDRKASTSTSHHDEEDTDPAHDQHSDSIIGSTGAKQTQIAASHEPWLNSENARNPSLKKITMYGALPLLYDSSAKPFSVGAKAFQVFSLQDSSNIIGHNLHKLGLDVSSLMALYENIVKFQSRDFEGQTDLVLQPGSTWKRFLTFICKDPTLMKVAILLTTRYVLSNRRNLDPRDMCSVLQIEGHLVHCINSQLQDPSRSLEDQMLVTILLVAGYEVKYGSIAAYRAHMNGLVEMINLRGGLPAIGAKDPFLERLIVWHDVNASKMAGCTTFCQQVENRSKVSEQKPNIGVFRMVEMKEHNAGSTITATTWNS